MVLDPFHIGQQDEFFGFECSRDFAGCDVSVEALVPEPTRRELARRGHELEVVPPRTGVFGYGQAVMCAASGVHFGASEPRHDGAAIPEAPPLSPGRSK